MSDKRLILHVGWPKTGTSSLQVFFAQNVAPLKLAGVTYPEIFDLSAVKRGYGQGNGYSLAYGLLDDGSVTRCNYPKYGLDDFRQLLAESDDHATILVSTEWFTALSDGALAKLGDVALAAGFHVVIVGYIRPYISFLNSEYAQGVKIGRISDPADRWRFNHSLKAVADRFRRVFGRSCLSYRPFSKDLWVGGSLYTDFLASVGVGEDHWDKFIVTEEANQSLQAESLNIQLGMNILGQSFSQQELGMIDELLRETGRRTCSGKSWFTERRLEEIRGALRGEVEYITAEYFPGNRFLLDEFERADSPGPDGCLNEMVLTLEEERELFECVYQQLVAAEARRGSIDAQAFARKANTRLLSVIAKSVAGGHQVQ